MNLVSKLESIYSNYSINSTYKYQVLFDPNSIPSQRFTAKVSRYKLEYPKCAFDPYELTPQVLMRLSNQIKICGGLTYKLTQEASDIELFQLPFFLRSTSDCLTILEPSTITNVMLDNTLTPNGLLSFRLKTAHTKQFRQYIEDNYLSEYYNKVDSYYLLKAEYLNEYNIDYFQLMNLIDSLSILSPDIRDSLILNLPYIWYWRNNDESNSSS